MNSSFNNNLLTLKSTIEKIANNAPSDIKKSTKPTLIAVSKTIPIDIIEEAIIAGQNIFGENKVQEAEQKFSILKEKYPNIELHLIGPLQSNKVAKAVSLFDVIETIDRDKIAQAVASEIQKQQKNTPCYIQVNTGLEPQKSGISPSEALDFIKRCQQEYKLNIKGLMCIAPQGQNPAPHFAYLAKLAKIADIPYLSMGMSQDLEEAIQLGATHVRIGSALFGKRA